VFLIGAAEFVLAGGGIQSIEEVACFLRLQRRVQGGHAGVCDGSGRQALVFIGVVGGVDLLVLKSGDPSAVDVDQSGESETVITSAMKGLSEATQWAITKMYNNEWADIGGIATSLGVENDAVGLPTAEESWGFETYTVEQYEASLAAVKSGELVVDGETITEGAIADVEFSNLVIDYI